MWQYRRHERSSHRTVRLCPPSRCGHPGPGRPREPVLAFAGGGLLRSPPVIDSCCSVFAGVSPPPVRDSAYYSVTDEEWPGVRANLERRLAVARERQSSEFSMSETTEHHARVLWQVVSGSARARDQTGGPDDRGVKRCGSWRRSDEGRSRGAVRRVIVGLPNALVPGLRPARASASSLLRGRSRGHDGRRALPECDSASPCEFTTDISQEIVRGLHDRTPAACFIANSVTGEVRVDMTD